MKRIRKKIAIILVLSLLMCSGCGSVAVKDAPITKPDQISVNGKLISYSDNEYKDFNKYVHEISKDNKLMKIEQEAKEKRDKLYIITNDEKKIRLIMIYDKNIKTYNGISVGDKASDIENKFKYVNTDYSNSYSVYFGKNGENYDSKETLLDDDNIIIQYTIVDGIIDSILIYDLELARKLI